MSDDMNDELTVDPYALGGVLQFLARHSDIHYDRSAISLAVRLSYAEVDVTLDQLVSWGLVNARQATIGVRVFGLIPPEGRSLAGPGLALVVSSQRDLTREAVRCLAQDGWHTVAVAELMKARFILERAAPDFALVDGFAEDGRIPWERLAELGHDSLPPPVYLWTNRQEVDDALAGQHGFRGIIAQPLNCAALRALAQRESDAALTER